MRLENIGFYTLSDSRVLGVSSTSPLQRCELVLTDRCNFNCAYCRGPSSTSKGELTLEQAVETLKMWTAQGLRNVRFSGGEPTVWKGLESLVRCAKGWGVERIAVSTNGSAATAYYDKLLAAGVNDFSISLDACCASSGDRMAGIAGKWSRVVDNIRHLSQHTYVTVGVVITEDNLGELEKIILFAHGLGVADIRIISAAQEDRIFADLKLPPEILDAHPILRYRVTNFSNGRRVRGLSGQDNNRCPLAMDDIASAGGYHYPCIIYMREHGSPVGKVGPSMREERLEWSRTHDVSTDPICRANCLDVCVDYNNRFKLLRGI